MARIKWTQGTYRMVAESIRTEVQFASNDSRCALLRTARNLADEFTADNPRFDRVRFLKACGFAEES